MTSGGPSPPARSLEVNKVFHSFFSFSFPFFLLFSLFCGLDRLLSGDPIQLKGEERRGERDEEGSQKGEYFAKSLKKRKFL